MRKQPRTMTNRQPRGRKPALHNRAGPRTISVQDQVAGLNAWRNYYNPLRGLTVSRAVSMLEQALTGAWTELQWTYGAPLMGIESSDYDLFAIIERRTSKICELDWSIKTVTDGDGNPPKDEKLASEQADFLRSYYDRIDNLTDAIEHMELSAFRGFSMVQPQRQKEFNILEPDRLEIVDNWNLVRNGWGGDWFWNPEAREITATSLPAENKIDLNSVVLMQVNRSINRLALLKRIRNELSDKDWDAFIEIYGISSPIIIMPPNVPEEKEEEYQRAAADLAEGAGGSLPHGSDVKYPDSVRGMSPFESRLKYLSEKLVLAGTGGMLTMLTASGSGTLAGSAHQETFEVIARSRAKKISQAFQGQLDRRSLALRFPGKPMLVYFEIAATEKPDVSETIKNAAALRQAGYKMTVEELSEETGYNLTEEPLPSAVPATGPLLNRAKPTKQTANTDDMGVFMATARMALAEAVSEDLQPIAEALIKLINDAENMSDEEFRDRLVEFQKNEFPALADETLDNTAASRVMNEIQSAALALGIEKGATETK